MTNESPPTDALDRLSLPDDSKDDDELIGYAIDAYILKTVEDFFQKEAKPEPHPLAPPPPLPASPSVSPASTPRPVSPAISGLISGVVDGSDLNPFNGGGARIARDLMNAFGDLNSVQTIVSAANTVFCIGYNAQNDRRKPEPGTGFLLRPHGDLPVVDGSPLYLLMTNNHVIDGADAAPLANLTFHLPDTPESYQAEFSFVPNRFFMSSVELDYTICGVQINISNNHPLNGKVRQLSLRDHVAPCPPGLSKYDYAIIIQYPGLKGSTNRDKRIAFGKLEGDDAGSANQVFRYLTSTSHGSSGSPVLNEYGRLVGLHNKSGPRARAPPNPPYPAEYSKDNGGVLMSAIVQDINKRLLQSGASSSSGPALSEQMKAILRVFL